MTPNTPKVGGFLLLTSQADNYSGEFFVGSGIWFQLGMYFFFKSKIRIYLIKKEKTSKLYLFDQITLFV